MIELPLLRFIPFRRSDVYRMCLAQGQLDTAQLQQFEQARTLIESHFATEFNGLKQQLKAAYAPLDPDADTRTVSGVAEGEELPDLAEALSAVLERANYEQVSQQALKAAFRKASLFQIRLHVRLADFDEALLYTRGASAREEEIKTLFGLWRRKVRFVNYDRVVLYIRFKDEVDSSGTLGGCRPGTTMLKLFQNVPDADLEMLFPNTRVGMRWLDRLAIGVPAVVSGGIVFSTKLGTTLVLLGSMLGFWLGLSSEEVQLDRTTLIALLAGMGALAGYIWKQLSSFRNRKLRFTQALTENLYFKLLDNNAGVLYRILDDAEESECKESLLAYYFLLASPKPLSAGELDQAIETWFAEHWECQLDFEIEDALRKLHQLHLASCDEGRWTPAAP